MYSYVNIYLFLPETGHRANSFEGLREESREGNVVGVANAAPVLAYGMDLAGFVGGSVGPPLVELSDRDGKRIERCYRRVEAEFDAAS